MKKIITLTVFTGIFTSSMFAARFSNDIRRGNHKQIINRHHVVHVRPNYVRPHRRHVIVRHRYRPHYVSLHHRVGHRIHRLRPSAIRLSVGGVGYRYSSGAFYRPYRSGFRVVRAPIGAVIGSLPVGYQTIYINNRNYYRYEDTYYDRCSNGYRVIEKPIDYTSDDNINYRYQVGDIALNLPAGAMEVIIDGKIYYEAEGRYFKRVRRDGRNVYEVVNI